MAIKVKELRGLESVWALNAYHTLVRGLALEQACLGQEVDTTLAKFEALDDAGKERELRRAFALVNLGADDMQNLLLFALDANGIPYAKRKLSALGPVELVEAMLAVCMEIAKITPKVCPNDVKKNCLADA